jgi:hypothetical protein
LIRGGLSGTGRSRPNRRRWLPHLSLKISHSAKQILDEGVALPDFELKLLNHGLRRLRTSRAVAQEEQYVSDPKTESRKARQLNDGAVSLHAAPPWRIRNILAERDEVSQPGLQFVQRGRNLYLLYL